MTSKTPSQQAKAAGFKTLTQVSRICNKSVSTLRGWSRDNPQLFQVILIGCATTGDKDD